MTVQKSYAPEYVAALERRVILLEAALSGPERAALPPSVVLSDVMMKLLCALIAGGGKPRSAELLMDILYGVNIIDRPNRDIIKVYISAVRRLLAGHVDIITYKGVGYAISEKHIDKLTGKEPW